jgi:hypothetical protein
MVSERKGKKTEKNKQTNKQTKQPSSQPVMQKCANMGTQTPNPSLPRVARDQA